MAPACSPGILHMRLLSMCIQETQDRRNDQDRNEPEIGARVEKEALVVPLRFID
jgi:hypothetical protein